MSLTENVLAKLERLAERQEELTRLLSDPEIANNRNQFVELGREYLELEPLTSEYRQYQKLISDLILNAIYSIRFSTPLIIFTSFGTITRPASITSS